VLHLQALKTFLKIIKNIKMVLQLPKIAEGEIESKNRQKIVDF
jgi:hypothetical protein